MTEDQLVQFNLYGCVSRCIIRITELRNTPISPDGFVSRYSYLFPPEKCGILSVDDICEVAKDLAIATTVDIFRNVDEAVKLLRKKQTSNLLVFTELDESEPPKFLNHCRLAVAAGIASLAPAQGSNEVSQEEVLVLYSPFQDGSAPELNVLLSTLESQLVHFLWLH